MHSLAKGMFTGQLLNKTTKHIYTAVMHDRNGNLFFTTDRNVIASAFGAIDLAYYFESISNAIITTTVQYGQ